MRTINIDGKEVVANTIDPIQSSEQWNEYQMPNGDLLKVKLVVTQVYIAANGAKNKAGENIYSVDFQPVFKVTNVK